VGAARGDLDRLAARGARLAGQAAAIDWVYGEVVRHLAVGERVRILVRRRASRSARARAQARRRRRGSACDFVRAPTDRSWTRDYCPLYVTDRDGEVAVTNWRFTGWAKYANHKRDDAVNDRIVASDRLRQWQPTAPIAASASRVRAGGRRHRRQRRGHAAGDRGVPARRARSRCATRACRARRWRRAGAHLGVRKVLWLGRGIAGDDTHGHVDDLARFVDETTGRDRAARAIPTT
jgi:agmatine deiminase